MPAPELMALVEHATQEGRMPNSGVWALRAGDEAQRFLDEVWAQDDLIDHRWWENAAICRLLGYSLDPVGPGDADRVAGAHDVPRPALELDPRRAGAAHPRIRHYPGYSTKVRAAFMARDLLLRRRA